MSPLEGCVSRRCTLRDKSFSKRLKAIAAVIERDRWRPIHGGKAGIPYLDACFSPWARIEEEDGLLRFAPYGQNLGDETPDREGKYVAFRGTTVVLGECAQVEAVEVNTLRKDIPHTSGVLPDPDPKNYRWRRP